MKQKQIMEYKQQWNHVNYLPFAKFGYASSVGLQERTTVNTQWYTNNCLPKVLEAWTDRRRHSWLPAENRVKLVTQIPYTVGERW